MICTTKGSSQSCLAGTVTTWATTFAPTVTMAIFVSFLPVWRSDGILSHGRPEVHSARCPQKIIDKLTPRVCVCVSSSKTLHDKQSTANTCKSHKRLFPDLDMNLHKVYCYCRCFWDRLLALILTQEFIIVRSRESITIKEYIGIQTIHTCIHCLVNLRWVVSRHHNVFAPCDVCCCFCHHVSNYL